jgi:6-phospho-3-hexuloisomerase
MRRTQIIMNEIKSVLEGIEEKDIDEFIEIMNNGNRIFVIGEGRSGFMGKSFAMRLMHLGAKVYVVGETITPAIEKGDILVAISGSGTTKNVVTTAERTKQLGCSVIVVTTNLDSELGKIATFKLHVPAATKYRRQGETSSIQPLGSLFDQCCHIIFDSICLGYAESKNLNNDDAFKKHSNLE